MPSTWPIRTLDHTDLAVGPCAWRITMLADHTAYAREHPSLIVALPDDTDETLAAAAPHLDAFPLMLVMSEPTFARRLASQVEQRLATTGRAHADALMLRVDEVTDLKSGGLLQAMFTLREQGLVRHLGLTSDDPLATEWIAANTAARLLGVPYSLHEQTVRWRTLDRAAEYGMAAISLTCPADDDALRFAVAEQARVLPLLDRPLPDAFDAMAPEEVAAAWQAFRSAHDEPPPLPRGRPPVGET